MTKTDLLMDAECRWCECGLDWNSRKQCWEDKDHETFCRAKTFFPFVHEAKEVDDSGAGSDIGDYS
jgi:hypothetical protein